MARHDSPPRQPKVGDIVLVRLPGSHDFHLYPAIVIRARMDILNVAVFVDSEVRSAAAQSPVVTCEGVEPLSVNAVVAAALEPEAAMTAGGWCWRKDDLMG